MDRILRAEEMRAWDRFTMEEIGVPSAVLMERAALSAAELVIRHLNGSGTARGRKALIFAGPGNNGGDGFACARILFLRGFMAEVIETGNIGSMTEETRRQRDICLALGIRVRHFLSMEREELVREVLDAGILVDAILGTGLKRPVTGELKDLLDLMGRGAGVAAIDIPSGISADTGEVLGSAVKADFTVTMQRAKPGLLLYPGAAYAGEVHVAEIGVVEPDGSRTGISGPAGPGSGGHGFGGPDSGISGSVRPGPIYSLDADDLKVLLPARDPSGNKGTFGKVLVIAGTKGMAGASVLAAMAALRTGCGMVKVLTTEDNRLILQSTLPEAMVSTYITGRDEEALAALYDGLTWCDAVLMGPGIGRGGTQRALLRELLARSAKTVVLDADALNLISEDRTLLKERASLPDRSDASEKEGGYPAVYITPHVGEMSRLTGLPISQIKGDLLGTAGRFAAEYRVNCILKDARSVSAAPDGTLYINTSGNSGMATAGSGDVLGGILASLLAQGIRPDMAAPAAALMHGLAGDAARKRSGERFMCAGDIVRALGDVL